MSIFIPPMPQFLAALRHRLVVVGSVARAIRNTDYAMPKDIDLLCDLDSDIARKTIATAIKQFGLKYESPFISCWTFRDYGWMVEILGIHHGPFYRAVRRRAEILNVHGIELWVAQPEDAPAEKRVS